MHSLPALPRRALVLAVALAAVLGALVVPHPAQANQTRRILHRPAVIQQPGVYDVGFNFATTGATPAIVVQSSDVTINFCGHSLEGPGDLQGVGVLVDGVDNVRISGGGLAGFQIGVQVVNSTNVVIDGMQIEGNDLGGAPPAIEIGVLLLDSRGVVVSGNTIANTFLGVFVRGPGSMGNRVSGNTIAGGEHGELAICFNPAPNQTEGGPAANLVTDNHVGAFNRGLSLSTDSAANIVRGNSFVTFGEGISEKTPGTNMIEDNILASLTP